MPAALPPTQSWLYCPIINDAALAITDLNDPRRSHPGFEKAIQPYFAPLTDDTAREQTEAATYAAYLSRHHPILTYLDLVKRYTQVLRDNGITLNMIERNMNTRNHLEDHLQDLVIRADPAGEVVTNNIVLRRFYSDAA